MAVFTTGTISSIVHTGDGEGEVPNIPLIPPQQLRRNYGKRSRWQRPAFLVGLALAGLTLAGIVMLWERNGGDSIKNQGSDYYDSNFAKRKSKSAAEASKREHAKRNLRTIHSTKKLSLHQVGAKTKLNAEKRTTQHSGSNPFNKKVHHGSYTDNQSAKDFNKYIDSQKGPKHTLGKALRKRSGKPYKKTDLKGGENKDKGRFKETYGEYLDREHGVKSDKTLHGKGIHPAHYHPPVTKPSSGNSFNNWLDKTHPVTRASSASVVQRHNMHSSSSVDQTGQEGHLGHGWYKQHNLHAALHPNSPQSENIGTHEEHEGHGRVLHRDHNSALAHADRRVQAHASRAEEHRSDLENKHFDSKGRHYTLHERNQEMEGKEGDYKFLSPVDREVWKAYDAIQASRKARAKESVGLKHLRTVVRQVQEPPPARVPAPPPMPPQQPGGYLSEFDGDAGGVLSHFSNDDKLTGGVLTHVGGIT